MTRIVLAYPDTVWGQEARRAAPDLVRLDDAISWLAEQHAAEIVTLMLDFGQGRELEALRDRALAAGAIRAHVLDVADQFAAEFLLPALRAGSLFLDGRATPPALARMAIAQKLVEIAAIEQTTLVAHGYPAADRSVATAVKSLDASMTVVPVPQSVLGPAGPPFAGAVSERRSEPATVELTFARGAPTAINGVLMPMIDLIGSLDMLSPAPGSRKNRRGTTAVMVMHDAHRALQESVGAAEAAGPADRLRHGSGGQGAGRPVPNGQRYAQLIAEGAWFSSERKALDAAVDRAEQAVTGTVRLQLVNDECRVVEIAPADTKTSVNVTTPK